MTNLFFPCFLGKMNKSLVLNLLVAFRVHRAVVVEMMPKNEGRMSASPLWHAPSLTTGSIRSRRSGLYPATDQICHHPHEASSGRSPSAANTTIPTRPGALRPSSYRLMLLHH